MFADRDYDLEERKRELLTETEETRTYMRVVHNRGKRGKTPRYSLERERTDDDRGQDRKFGDDLDTTTTWDFFDDFVHFSSLCSQITYIYTALRHDTITSRQLDSEFLDG